MELLRELLKSHRSGASADNSSNPAKMGSNEAISGLNEMAGKTPRKRHQPSDSVETSASKRRSVTPPVRALPAPESKVHRTSPRLKRKSQSTASREVRNRDDPFAMPPDEVPPKSQEQDVVTKPKKKVQLRGAKPKQPDPSPFKGHDYGSLNPLENTKARLTSTDSPAKRTRSKLAHVTSNPLNALRNHPIVEKPPPPPKNSKTAVEVQLPARHKSQNTSLQSQRSASQNDGVNTREEDAINESLEEKRSTRISPRKTQQTASKPTDPTETSERSKRRPMSEEERKKREEEKRAQKQKDRLTDIENQIEHESSEAERFEEWSRMYLQGIEEAATKMNKSYAWSQMGGACYKIIDIASPTADSSSARRNGVYRQIDRTFKLYKRLNRREGNTADLNRIILENIDELRHQTENNVLQSGDDPKTSEDSIVTDLYSHAIPRHVRLMREALVARYHDGLSHQATVELLKLARAGDDLCNIALRWKPIPSTLDTDIRKAVRSQIKPSLNQILFYFRQQAEQLAYKAWDDEQNRRLRERQIESEKLMQKRSTKTFNIRALSIVQPVAEKVVDIDDIDLQHDEAVQPQPDSNGRQERQSTEEIPAPDPLVKWTDIENVALLNGLQKYLSSDRYSHILSSYPQLRGKDLDQIMAQAQYFKRASKSRIEQLLRQGDHSLDWLETVVL